MLSHCHLNALCAVFIALCANTFAQDANPPTDAAVQRRMQELIGAITASQRPDGSWNGLAADLLMPDVASGHVSLHLLALASAGQKDSAAAQKALSYILAHPPRSFTYSLSLHILALEAMDSLRHRPEIERVAAILVKGQAADGSWNYDCDGSSGDPSITQFAIMGLASARRLGVSLDPEIFARTERFYLGTQRPDGGWGYRSPDASTASMTAAGMGSLALCGRNLERSLELAKGPGYLGQYEADPQLAAAAQRLHGLLQAKPKELANGYTAYAVERAGIFHDRRLLHGLDWYAQGCRSILAANPEGYCPLPFAMLFLAKGNAPLLLGKLSLAGQPQEALLRRYDAREFARTMSSLLQQPLEHCSVRLNAADPFLAKLPLLYWSGYHKPELNESERRLLKSFLDQGGTLLISGALSSQDFTEGALRELAAVTGPGSFIKVPQAHELRGMLYDLRQTALPFTVWRAGCREHRVFFAASDISLAWESTKADETLRLASANLALYALRQRPALPRLRQVTPLAEAALPAPPPAPAAGTASTSEDPPGSFNLALATLSCQGQQSSEAAAWATLSAPLAEAAKIPLSRRIVTVPLAEAGRLAACPVLILSATGSFKLSPGELKNLREYLANGGFLIMEACCGCPEFDTSARALLAELGSAHELQEQKAQSPLLSTPWAGIEAAGPDGRPTLYALRLQQRFAAVYCPRDLVHAATPPASSPGLAQPQASRLLANILHYALTQ